MSIFLQIGDSGILLYVNKWVLKLQNAYFVNAKYGILLSTKKLYFVSGIVTGNTCRYRTNIKPEVKVLAELRPRIIVCRWRNFGSLCFHYQRQTLTCSSEHCKLNLFHNTPFSAILPCQIYRKTYLHEHFIQLYMYLCDIIFPVKTNSWKLNQNKFNANIYSIQFGSLLTWRSAMDGRLHFEMRVGHFPPSCMNSCIT